MAAWAILAGVGILLNLLIEYVLQQSNAPESVKTLLSQVALGVPIFLGFAIMLTGLADIVRLIKASFEGDQDTGEDFASNEE